MMYRIFKLIFYNFFLYSGITKYLIRKKLGTGKIILTYHNVLLEKNLSRYYVNNVDVSSNNFIKHLQWLEEIKKIEDIQNLNDSEKNNFFLSFDDGMLNNITLAYPILKARGKTAMFAICTGLLTNEIDYLWRDEIFLLLKSLIGQKLVFEASRQINNITVKKGNINEIAQNITTFIQENNMEMAYETVQQMKRNNKAEINLCEAEKNRFSPMNIENITYLLSEGNTIASHTHLHLKLAFLSKEKAEIELVTSKAILENISRHCQNLVYPYGSPAEISDTSKDQANKSGYIYAYMNCASESSSSHSIDRINITNISSKATYLGVIAGLNKIIRLGL